MRTRESSLSLFVGEDDEVDDSDVISLTSTVDSEHDADEEFVVDAVLAEVLSGDLTQGGEMLYLIKWETYPLERCTWESEENLSDELREQWQEQQQEELDGRRRPFNLQEYEDAVAEATRGKAERHARRNAKRQQLNLPLTEPFPPGYMVPTSISQSIGESGCSDEVMEVEEIDLGRAATISRKAKEKQTSETALTTDMAAADPSSIVRQPPKPQIPASNPQETATTSENISAGSQSTARRPGENSAKTAKPSTTRHVSSASTSSLANKFSGKRLKATRTANPMPLLPIRKATASGAAVPTVKARKRRQGLKESMMDPTKAPKFMSNMRLVNQLKKKAGELNDSAPVDPSAIPAGYFITSEPPSRNNSGDIPNDRFGDSRLDANSPADTSVQSAIAPSTGPKRSRSGKTVRFVEGEVNLTSAGILNDVSVEPGTAIPETAPKRLSMTSQQEKKAPQAVAKSATFGPEGSQEIRVVFNNIPQSHREWIMHFLAEDVLQFRAVCSAEDFFYFGNNLYRPDFKLASGKLESETGGLPLDALAANLRRSSSALYLVSPAYSILVFPGQCPAWVRPLDPFQASTDTLKYLIFRVVMAKKPLFSEHYPMYTDAAAIQAQPVDPAALRIKLIGEVAAFDYDVLLATKHSGDKHVFFLLFHPFEETVFGALVLWLRACRPDGLIFHSREPGGWKRYREETKAGAIIISKSIEKNIRRIPRLWDTLKHGAHSFWSLSSSDHKTSLTPLIPKVPPQLTMTRLFPHGRAFLLTPSFVISQPGKLCVFLDWFRHRSTFAPCVLVVCADFPGFLLDVAMGKALERDLLLRKLGDSGSHEASARGLTEENHKQRLRAWELMNDILDLGAHKIGPYEDTPEDIRKVVCASDLIAPDDEQSLVNWFAAWSTSRIDSYRKFYVLGSGVVDRREAYRAVPVPNYIPGTINNPDSAFDTPRSHEISHRRSTSSATSAFQSQLLKREHPAEFTAWINELLRTSFESSFFAFWLHPKPVSWLDINMAERCGDFTAEYHTFTHWLYEFRKFDKKTNTCVGVFYTTETDWDGEGNAPSVVRHPWLALFRPVNPHLSFPYTQMELLIWDCSANFGSSGQATRDELLPMQLRLIDFVRTEIPNRFSEYSLHRVFVGDRQVGAPTDSEYPVDITLQTLKTFVGDRKLWIPPYDKVMIQRGWKILVDEVASDFPRIPADQEQPERIIFHPPRGDAEYRSKCKNGLYVAALRARRAEPQCTTFDYDFQPTVEWYRLQEGENRGFQHIYVECWDMVFNDLGLEKH